MVTRILVVGGSYFAGRVFVQNLSQRRDLQVHVVNRGNAPLNLENVVEWKCDRNNAPALRNLLSSHSFDTVVDFCAYGPEHVTTLFQALPPDRIGRYLLVSTVSVYAPTTDLPVAEDAPKLAAPQPGLGPAAHYGFDKHRAEYASMAQCQRRGIPYTHVRPAIIYGKFNYAPRESYFFDLIHSGRPVVIPENDLALFSFVSVWDVAQALELCLENERSFNASFNLAAPELVSYSRLVEVLEQVVGKKAVLARASPQAIDAQRIPLPFPLESHLVYSGEKASRILDLSYLDFVKGMEQTWEWCSQTQLDRGV